MISQIGKYTIEKELGHGGFGDVFLALDPDVGQKVAIKHLRVELGTDPDMLRRFQYEIRTTASLRHRNIVAIFASGVENGNPYLVMEFLEGKTLKDIIQSRLPLSLLEKVNIMTQAAEGLAYAHSKGIVHRDVKPENIMILPDETVKIMDFGIALAADRNTVMTETGGIIGTPPYFSPEQLQGYKANEQSDIFSLGDVYYELLTGQHPFERFKHDWKALQMAILSFDPPAVSQLVPSCPEALELLVHRMIAKEREFRYATFEELLLDSKSILVDMQHDRAAVLLREVSPLVEAGDLQSALARLREVQQLEPGNREARQLRDTITQRLQKSQVQGRVAELLTEAQAFMAERRFAEAVSSLESAARLDSSNVDVQVRLGDAKSKLDSSVRASRLVSEARFNQQKGHLTEALERLVAALAIDPDHTEAMALRPRVRDAVDRRERENRLQKALHIASDHLAAKRYGEALAAIEQIEREQPDAAEPGQLRERILQAKEDERRLRAERFNMAVSRTREAMETGELDRAGQMLDHLLANFAADPGAAEVLPALREQLNVRIRAQQFALGLERLLHDARELMAGGRYAETIGRLTKAPEYSGEAEVRALLESARAAEAAEEERRVVSGAQAGAERLSLQGDSAGALSAVEEALVRYPRNAGLSKTADRLRDQIARERRRISIENHRTSIRREMDSGAWTKAEAALLKARAEFPGENAFDELAKDVETGLFNARLEEVSSQVRAKLAAGDLAGAVQQIDAKRAAFAHDSRWKALTEEVTKRKQYETALMEAERHRKQGDLSKAENLLTTVIREGVADQRATQIVHAIQVERSEAARKAEIAAREAEQKRKAEIAAREAEEKRKAEIAAREAEEKRKAEIAAREAEEKRKAEIAAREAEEKRKAEIAAREAEEKRKTEIASREAEENRKAEIAARETEQKRQAEIAAREAEQKRQADGAAREAEQKRQADIAAREAEQKRQADIAARDAEQKRQADIAAREAEQKRQADVAARDAEQKRKAEIAAKDAAQKRQAEIAAAANTVRTHLKADQIRPALSALIAARAKFPGEEVWTTLGSDIDSRQEELKRQTEIAAQQAAAKRQAEIAAREAQKRQADIAAREAAAKRQAETETREAAKRLAEIEAWEGIVRGYLERDELRTAAMQLGDARAKYPGETRWAGLETAIRSRKAELEALEKQRQEPPVTPVPPRSAAAPPAVLEVPHTKQPLPWKWIGGGIGAAAVVVAGVVVAPHISSKKVTPPPPPVVTKIPVEIRTDPPGALVKLGDRSCVTPACRFELAPGPYQVQAELKGFEPAAKTLTVDASKNPNLIDLTLTPVVTPPPPVTATMGRLLVSAGQAGALVLVDGKNVGRTDATGSFPLPLEAKTYEIRVEKDKFQSLPASRSVKVIKDGSQQIDFKLIPKEARLRLVGAPANVEVKLGNRLLGRTNATGDFTFPLTLPSGRQVLTVADGSATRTAPYEFQPDETLTVNWKDVAPGKTGTTTGPTGTTKGPTEAELEAQDWERVRNSTDLAAVRAFVAGHPRGVHKNDADVKMESLTWTATNKDNLESLRAYLRDFSGGAHASEAQKRLTDLAWNRVDQNKAEDVRKFLADNPDSPYKANAQRILNQLDEAQRLRAKQELAKQETAKLELARKQEVLDALKRFDSALQRGQKREAAAVWPRISPDFRDAIGTARTTMSLVPKGDVRLLDAERATVTCDLIRTTNGTSKSQTATLLLRNSGTGWLIDSLKVE